MTANTGEGRSCTLIDEGMTMLGEDDLSIWNRQPGDPEGPEVVCNECPITSLFATPSLK